MAFHFWAVAEAAAERAQGSARSDAAGYAAGLLTWLLAGSAFIAVKIGVQEMPPWMFCCLRALAAALVLLPLVAPHRLDMINFLRKHWLEAFIIGALGLGLTQGAMFTALSYTSAINVGIMFATTPMLTMVMARFLLRERMTGGQGAGMLIAFAGIVVITVHGSLSLLLGLKIGFGDLIALCAVVAFACYTVLLKRAKFTLPPLPLLVILLCAGSIASLPFSLLEVWNGEHSNLVLKGYLSLLYTATIAGALVYLLYNWSIEVLGASRAGMLVYTQMIYVAFFAWLILGEAIEWYHYVGGGLVVVGIILVTTLGPKAAAATQ